MPSIEKSHGYSGGIRAGKGRLKIEWADARRDAKKMAQSLPVILKRDNDLPCFRSGISQWVFRGGAQ